MSLPLSLRDFREQDIPDLLALMRELAEFEGYLDEFAVTAEALKTRGLGEAPEFGVKVAIGDAGQMLGMAVYYSVPWTFDLRPSLVLKELYVRASARSLGVGRSLMVAVAQEALARGAGRLLWTVMTGNTAAEAFYRRLSGVADRKWQPWGMDPRALARLAATDAASA